MPQQHKNNDSKQVVRKQNNPSTGYTMYSYRNPVATRLRTILLYREFTTSTTAAGPGDVMYSYNLNGLFDPNQTGTGHQPRGYDQLSALYQRYRVYRVRYEVSYSLAYTNSTSPAYVGLSCTNAAIGTSFNDVVEQPHSTVKPCTPAMAVTISGSVDLAQLNGKTPTAYASDDTTQALTGANPTEILRLQLAMLDVTGLARAVYVHTTLWYDCEFSDPVQLAQS